MHKLKSAIVFLFILFSVLFFAITTTQAALAPGNTSLKKGIGLSIMVLKNCDASLNYNNNRACFNRIRDQLKNLGVSWYYDWILDHQWNQRFDNSNFEYVPMIHSHPLPNLAYPQSSVNGWRNLAQSKPGSYWLIWNEPDLWRTNQTTGAVLGIAESAALAARLYDQISTNIRSSDPNAKLIIGGMSNQGDQQWYNWAKEFLDVYKSAHNQNLPDFQGWAIHLYKCPGTNVGNWNRYSKDSWRYNDIDTFRNKVNDELGGSLKELWLTEFGCLSEDFDTIIKDQLDWKETYSGINRYAWFWAGMPPGQDFSNFKGNLFSGVPTSASFGLSALGQIYAQYPLNPLPPFDTTPPSSPTNLSATAISSTQINLSWTASTDNVGVTGYRIYRCQGSGCTPSTQLATATSTSYSNTGLSASTAYTYTVSAYDAAGNVSLQSSSASATTQAPADTTPPAAPSGVTVY